MQGSTAMIQATPQNRAASASIELVALCDVESPVLQRAVAAWQGWRGERAMPPRERLSMRELGAATKHISLARVLDGGKDYEFRIIGDAHVQAYGPSAHNRRVSDVLATAPAFGRQIKASYDLVRKTRCGYAFRCRAGWDAPDSRFVLFETCYLPLGDDADTVDHILNVAVYASQRAT
jgi:hypothetical protein